MVVFSFYVNINYYKIKFKVKMALIQLSRNMNGSKILPFIL